MSRARPTAESVLSNWSSPDWDEPTRRVVRERLAAPGPLRFLSERDAATLGAAVDCIVPWAASAGIEVVARIDQKLALDLRDGYRYQDVPPLRDAWRLGLAGLEESAQAWHGRGYVELDGDARAGVLRRLQLGEAHTGVWAALSPRRFFRDVLCLTVVKLCYGHPSAWSAIGYSGPSSPRGHVRVWLGGVDPWEAPGAGR